jgi:hypothetical protein
VRRGITSATHKTAGPVTQHHKPHCNRSLGAFAHLETVKGSVLRASGAVAGAVPLMCECRALLETEAPGRSLLLDDPDGGCGSSCKPGLASIDSTPLSESEERVMTVARLLDPYLNHR